MISRSRYMKSTVRASATQDRLVVQMMASKRLKGLADEWPAQHGQKSMSERQKTRVLPISQVGAPGCQVPTVLCQ